MTFAHKIFFLFCFFSFTSLAQAYVGPGAGLSAIGTIFAFVVAIVLMIVGFLWYPIKRLIKGKKASNNQSNPLSESSSKTTDTE